MQVVRPSTPGLNPQVIQPSGYARPEIASKVSDDSATKLWRSLTLHSQRNRAFSASDPNEVAWTRSHADAALQPVKPNTKKGFAVGRSIKRTKLAVLASYYAQEFDPNATMNSVVLGPSLDLRQQPYPQLLDIYRAVFAYVRRHPEAPSEGIAFLESSNCPEPARELWMVDELRHEAQWRLSQNGYGPPPASDGSEQSVWYPDRALGFHQWQATSFQLWFGPRRKHPRPMWRVAADIDDAVEMMRRSQDNLYQFMRWENFADLATAYGSAIYARMRSQLDDLMWRGSVSSGFFARFSDPHTRAYRERLSPWLLEVMDYHTRNSKRFRDASRASTSAAIVATDDALRHRHRFAELDPYAL